MRHALLFSHHKSERCHSPSLDFNQRSIRIKSLVLFFHSTTQRQKFLIASISPYDLRLSNYLTDMSITITQSISASQMTIKHQTTSHQHTFALHYSLALKMLEKSFKQRTSPHCCRRVVRKTPETPTIPFLRNEAHFFHVHAETAQHLHSLPGWWSSQGEEKSIMHIPSHAPFPGGFSLPSPPPTRRNMRVSLPPWNYMGWQGAAAASLVNLIPMRLSFWCRLGFVRVAWFLVMLVF